MNRSTTRDSRQATLRALPSVDEVLRRLEGQEALAGLPRTRLVAAVRAVLAAERSRIVEGVPAAPDVDGLGRRVMADLLRAGPFSLVPVINVTGVVLHTNLGRALLSPLAIERLERIAGAYSNVELDVTEKSRGSRYVHVEGLLCRLTEAEAAMVVNNNAAAVLLALESLARGKDVVVSRGELIEIGGEFRIPDIMRRAGAVLREVGTTNRTHLRDYAGAIGPDTGLLLKVHSSNYRVLGFTAQVSARDLVELGRERGLPVMEDLGSGCLVDLRPYGFPHEPTVQEAIAAGLDLVTFSGDKLLGGPQAGLILGRRELIDRLKKNPLNRALRIDKLTLAALEATLYAYEAGTAQETVPTLRMLTEPLGAVRRRARRLLRLLSSADRTKLGATLAEGRGEVGGGALPLVELPTVTVALSPTGYSIQELDQALRSGKPPVIARIAEDRLILDCRTVQNTEVPLLAQALSRLPGLTPGGGGPPRPA
ncbi:MAG: L-seryl-tRNA(Sec) selenium transferase [Candidatus Methylomirabilia bacterium]